VLETAILTLHLLSHYLWSATFDIILSNFKRGTLEEPKDYFSSFKEALSNLILITS
jgi:hypothetical protein